MFYRLCNNYFDKPDDYEYNSVYFFMSLRMLYEKLYNNFAMFGTDDQSLVFEKINLYNSIIRPYDGFPTPVIENFCDIMLDNSIPSVVNILIYYYLYEKKLVNRCYGGTFQL